MKDRINIVAILIMLVGAFLTACAGATQENIKDEGLPPVAAVKAREALSEALEVNIAQVTIVEQEQKTWSDSCLGLGGIAESCLQAETPGWEIKLSVDGQSYTVRTDETGEQVRFEDL